MQVVICISTMWFNTIIQLLTAVSSAEAVVCSLVVACVPSPSHVCRRTVTLRVLLNSTPELRDYCKYWKPYKKL